jgi:putative transcriptional regulator
MTKVGQTMLKRLGAFVEALEKNQKIGDRFTCRKIELNLVPKPYNSKKIKNTRAVLGLSQALFAQFLGVSPRTVAAWERGAKTPQDIACRFMDEIRRNPAYWRDRLAKSARPKSKARR